MMGASRAALLGGWLHVCWAATRLSELAPSPEDAAPNSIALYTGEISSARSDEVCYKEQWLVELNVEN